MNFPILDHDLLRQLPKSQKREDIRRMVESPNSEDYVTWNVFALLKRIPPERWWPRMVALARCDNPNIADLENEAVRTPEL